MSVRRAFTKAVPNSHNNYKNMKTKQLIMACTMTGALALTGCAADVLDVSPNNMVSAEDLLKNESGVRVNMANLYGRLPIEDFAFDPEGYNHGTSNYNGHHSDMMTDNCCNSQTWKFPQGSTVNNYFKYWEDGWKLNRDINYLISVTPSVQSISDEKKIEVIAEARFLRAFTYFEMAKRYGGLPIVTMWLPYTPGVDSLIYHIPRSTEEATYNFILADLDTAAMHLPTSRSGDDARRITKWGCLAFKSRVALHAASLAKYNSTVGFSGGVKERGLIGMSGDSLANAYYHQCEDAAKQVMDAGVYALYKPHPASVDEAISNIMAYFQNVNISPEESIIVKGYKGEPRTGHSADFWWGPNQTKDGAAHPGRMCPSVSLVEAYETYSNPGTSSPIQTYEDGNVTRVENFNKSRNYIHYVQVQDAFKDKDARLWATIIIPGTTWKGQIIRIQSGYVQTNGTAVQNGANHHYEANGEETWTYGAENWQDYSGFQIAQAGNMTRTGFCFKKFLNPGRVDNNNTYGNSFQDWPELRYAEVLLNYAEAVAENDTADVTKAQLAEDCLNATRFRAGHTVRIPLTLDNVLRERRVEFAFENKRWWDLNRRRETHIVMDHYYNRALSPMLDFRTKPASYILLRQNVQNVQTLTFPTYRYYLSIPNVTSNGLVQNPNS